MLAADGQSVSLLDQTAARIQARVGEFLQKRAILTNLLMAKDLTVQSKARELLVEQAALEKLLPQEVAKIDQMKQGGWSIGSVVSVGNFAYRMERHIRNVDKLASQHSGISPAGFRIPPGVVGALPFVGIAVLAAILLRRMK